MYLRPTPRKNKDGSVVRYLQLAHNAWDPVAKRSKATVIYNFGREDTLDRAALQRLIGSVSRYLDPDAAVHDAAVRASLIAHLEETIAGSDKLTATKRAELRGVISTKLGLNRFLRVTPGGLLRTNARAAESESNLDGKYLLRCSDPDLSAEDIALGYKQLLEVERGWRDMKQVIDLRPVYHRKEERIRAHVLLCWLALLLVRVVETTCDDTWPNLRHELERLKVGTFTGPAGTFRQRSEITTPQRAILAKLEIAEPPRIQELTPRGASS